jgi:tetratricopeptide (TPR) repeat protein
VERGIQIKRRARRLVQTGEIAAALQEYEKLFTSGECDPYDYVAAGDLHVRRGQKEQAIERYVEAANAYGAVGLYKNAIAVLKKVLRTDPGRRDVHLTLAELFALEGLAGDAARHYLEFARGGDADDARVTEALEKAEALLHGRPATPADAGGPAGVADVSLAWESPSSQVPEGPRGVVTVRDEAPSGETVDIESLIGELTEGLRNQLSGADPQSHYDLGLSHMEMGLFEEALEEFEKAEEDSSLSLRAIEMAGLCLVRLGRAEDAVRHLGRGLAIGGCGDRELLGLRYNLALALEQAGRREEAERQYDHLNRTDPAFLASRRGHGTPEVNDAMELE